MKSLPSAGFLSASFLSMQVGAGGGGRTRTVSLPLDFESSTSANSITPAFIFSKSCSRCPDREIGGTSWRDIKNQIHIELSKVLANQGFSARRHETTKWILSPPRLPIPTHRPVLSFYHSPVQNSRVIFARPFQPRPFRRFSISPYPNGKKCGIIYTVYQHYHCRRGGTGP